MRFHPPLAALCVALGLAFLPGCASTFPNQNLSYLRPKLPPNEGYVQALVVEYSHQEFMHDLYTSQRDALRPDGTWDPAYARANAVRIDGAPPYHTFEGRRNKIINDLMFVINDYYDKYELSRYTTTVGAGLAADLVTMGLNATAAITGTAGLKSILSAIAAGVTGAKAQVQKDFFQQQSLLTIIHRMRANRDAVAKRIRANMTKRVSEYSLEDAIVELQEYFHAGTVLGALQDIEAETGKKAEKAAPGTKTKTTTQSTTTTTKTE